MLKERIHWGLFMLFNLCVMIFVVFVLEVNSFWHFTALLASGIGAIGYLYLTIYPHNKSVPEIKWSYLCYVVTFFAYIG